MRVILRLDLACLHGCWNLALNSDILNGALLQIGLQCCDCFQRSLAPLVLLLLLVQSNDLDGRCLQPYVIGVLGAPLIYLVFFQIVDLRIQNATSFLHNLISPVLFSW